MADHKIKTTLNPEETVTVNDAELLDLTRWGLVVEDSKTKKESN